MLLQINPTEKTIKILNQDKILLHDLVELLDESFKDEFWRNYTLILKDSKDYPRIFHDPIHYDGTIPAKSFMPLEFDAYKPKNKETSESQEDSNTG